MVIEQLPTSIAGVCGLKGLGLTGLKYVVLTDHKLCLAPWPDKSKVQGGTCGGVTPGVGGQNWRDNRFKGLRICSPTAGCAWGPGLMRLMWGFGGFESLLDFKGMGARPPQLFAWRPGQRELMCAGVCVGRCQQELWGLRVGGLLRSQG